ncbi:GABA permease [Nissabacter sp. SGAir0207]|uniref:GABA permease n=1 Tax=Nissabacter sp. SGAir0207 TaxID=2126321 RepID=UPI0010CD59F1|nr:GABA permease [Nissabacter sp. SGAir0207]
MSKTATASDLNTNLRARHITMLSIGGVIGAGLFVGSGSAVALAGPASIISYAIAGLLVVLIMRMLGEMAAASPDSGSFSTYADRAIGKWAGYTIGWLYWWFWVLVIPLEANVAATILHGWFESVPVWTFSLFITLALTGSNLLNVKNYGEFEFWLALTKVIAILAFIVIGCMALTGVIPSAENAGLSLMWSQGGFMPHGIGSVLAAVLITMFSFMGTEIVTIAAAETSSPAEHVVRATRSVIGRISVFYLGSIFMVITLVPWNSHGLTTLGSYQTVLESLHIPYAKLIMDCVILLAVTSCLNSALYTASRMLFSLSKRGDAPALARKTNRVKTPYVAVMLSTIAAFLTVIANYYAPKNVFDFLIASTGSVALLVYLVIAISQLRMRTKMRHDQMPIRMWGYPWITLAVIAFIVVMLACMLFMPDQRGQVLATLILAAAVVLSSFWVHRKKRDQRAPAGQLEKSVG